MTGPEPDQTHQAKHQILRLHVQYLKLVMEFSVLLRTWLALPSSSAAGSSHSLSLGPAPSHACIFSWHLYVPSSLQLMFHSHAFMQWPFSTFLQGNQLCHTLPCLRSPLDLDTRDHDLPNLASPIPSADYEQCCQALPPAPTPFGPQLHKWPDYGEMLSYRVAVDPGAPLVLFLVSSFSF